MRALDQFRKFFATIADGIARAWPSSGLNRQDREWNKQRALLPDDQRGARTTQIARDDDKRVRAPSGSYPAVWPR